MDLAKENLMDLQKTSAQEEELTNGTHDVVMEDKNKASVGVEIVKSDGIKTEESKTESSTKASSNGKLGHQFEDRVRNSSSEQLSLPVVDGVICNGEVLMRQQDLTVESFGGVSVTEESSCVGLELPQHSVVGNLSEEIMKSATAGEENDAVKEDMPNVEHSGLRLKPDDTKNSCLAPSECDVEEKMNPIPYDENHSSPKKSGLPFQGEEERKLSTEDSVLPNEGDATNSNSDNMESEPANKTEKKGSVKPRGKGNTKSTRVLRGSPRILRSRLPEKPKNPVPVVSVTEKSIDSEKTMKGRKKKKANNVPVNEFVRARSHLKYLIKRMSYEQNLIDAYSGEGWKGQSIEKVKLAEEIQRAKSEIVRTKLKIRDLFKGLDSSIAVGKLPESLFDSEGEIDSEDIFCAKCGSKDLLLNNDIILCDGACERAFHQMCLDPPLLKEDIPPDDKGWLCPGCDCKVDCIDFLNNSQGTNLSVLDSWEKVFPEVASSGKKLDDISDYPSDDSEDNDYKPDNLDVDAEMGEGDESSSDESDFYSASDGTGASPDRIQELNLSSDEASPDKMQEVNLSSDDSEDDNYNPDAPDLDQQINSESSCSDFSSDSEDFGGILAEDKPKEELVSISADHTRSNKKGSLNGELKSLMEESNLAQGDISLSSGKRQVKRLDYKKLQDETYGNVSSDSEDDNSTKRKKNKSIKRDSPSTSGRKTTNSGGLKEEEDKCVHTPKRGTPSQKLKSENKNGLHESSPNSSEQVSSAKKSGSRRLGETATQGLLKSFNENQYPDRSLKENLAMELGITVHQVNKWFINARWSFRNGPRMEAVAAETAREKVAAKSESPASKQGSGRKKRPAAAAAETAREKVAAKSESPAKSKSPASKQGSGRKKRPAAAAAASSSRNTKRKVDSSIENEAKSAVEAPVEKGLRRGRSRKIE
ncbi:pathogenesis-related homeodomain protein isoform X1 [Impatiens glandulifera]|uniref:pathogenesis-related homeodomain protein isoform X1 n=1 Tax=Impatiens glandulifera TaxID=253017 RepID=UPI001FB15C94|nr:pathogenesis-related homeodomain protein isoform X1 [Impatiens glandulifera]